MENIHPVIAEAIRWFAPEVAKEENVVEEEQDHQDDDNN